MAVRFEEHVGEVCLRVDAPSFESLFEQAAVALCDLTVGPTAPAAGEIERVEVRASDREALLVAWLNELVYRSESRKRVYPEAHVDRIGDRELSATIRGVEPVVIRTAVKAATLHDVEVRQTATGWTARVVLDV